MRLEGTLKRWNDDRGFGFITPADGGADLFVHISAFPFRTPRPAVNERLSFEVETTADGKRRAVKVLRPDTPSPRLRSLDHSRPRKRRGKSAGIGVLLIGILVLIGLANFRLGGDTHKPAPATTSPPATSALPVTKKPPAAKFRCDGRIYCSQMRSCEEATFFLKNCPGVKMDGNHDGVPCEAQWCG